MQKALWNHRFAMCGSLTSKREEDILYENKSFYDGLVSLAHKDHFMATQAHSNINLFNMTDVIANILDDAILCIWEFYASYEIMETSASHAKLANASMFPSAIDFAAQRCVASAATFQKTLFTLTGNHFVSNDSRADEPPKQSAFPTGF